MFSVLTLMLRLYFALHFMSVFLGSLTKDLVVYVTIILVISQDREFHARPLPSLSPEQVVVKPGRLVEPEPFNLATDERGAVRVQKWNSQVSSCFYIILIKTLTSISKTISLGVKFGVCTMDKKVK